MSQHSREFKLGKLFDGILRGTQSINPSNYFLFLEALCLQSDPATCVSKITTSKAGLASLTRAMRCDLSPKAFNGIAADLLAYLQSPELQIIGQGDFLNSVVLAIAEPPIFWNAFRKAFQDSILEIKAQIGFAWLLLQLVSLPGQSSTVYREESEDFSLIDKLGNSSSLDVRNFSQKIRVIVTSLSVDKTATFGKSSPGGRHDNDFADFREIAILPTADEISSTESPFLRTSDEIHNLDDRRLAVHLDNQFRLLREDMLHDIREELQIVLNKKKGLIRNVKLDGLKLIDLHFGEEKRRVKWGIQLECPQDFSQLRDKDEIHRKKYFSDNRQILKHGSLTGLLVDGEIVAFPILNRDEDLLSGSPPIIVLQFEGQQSVNRALTRCKVSQNISVVQVGAAVFAFDPVLRALQRLTSLQLERDILYYEPSHTMDLSPVFQHIVQAIEKNPSFDLQSILNAPKSIVLDQSQANSLLSGLTNGVALIQGPPGTGKSFIGAILAKAFYASTNKSILVVCYTNHALDDVLTHLIDIGIPESVMVRLGGKTVTRTENLTLYKQGHVHRRGREEWQKIQFLRGKVEDHLSRLQQTFTRYSSTNVAFQDVMNYLEFEDHAKFEAFQVPKEQDGMVRVGRGGKATGPEYLFHQWIRGWNGGIFHDHPVVTHSPVWHISFRSRLELLEKWKMEIFKDQVSELCDISLEYNKLLEQLSIKQADNDIAILKSKRIIGCTTTAAAKYGEVIQAAMPGILLVEEAGEILESHVLTAMGKHAEKLILIGDHKQLRPKVNNYKLTVEKGEGFDLNVSMFERLILNGFPHSTLSQQHRMRPEISDLIRQLTYPELVDAPKTQNRPNLRGVQDNIVFINHSQPEKDLTEVLERRDVAMTPSKRNEYEKNMILKIVRYLGQQGYGTDNLVILTPYLGQLHNFRVALQEENDPILNDLDSFDLVQAGIVTPATAKLSKKPIRLATIDNYQGEESEIVLISLTRSNAKNDIGFMFSPERLNVLLSRAKNALIIIGNLKCFMNARKGSELWTQLFSLLKNGNHIYDGLPVQCDRHPDRRALLEKPEDFDLRCPDGGCMEPCGAQLSCGTHTCLSKCHQIADHSKMKCEHIMYSKCPIGHNQPWKCSSGIPLNCFKCEEAQQLAERKQKEAFERQQKEDAERIAHQKKLQELEDQIVLEQETMQNARLANDRANALLQKQKDLELIKERARNMKEDSNNATPAPSVPSMNLKSNGIVSNKSSSPDTQGQVPSSPPPPVDVGENSPQPDLLETESEREWKYRKDVEGASNDAIDAIMGLVGLNEVKGKVLEIYDKVEVTKRQGTDLKRERFNAVFLGNPGTGKTTVARQYAKFLASLQVLPGSEFVETTGAKMADEGVPSAKKQIEKILNAGGGAMFIDEAYQLTSPHAYQGRQVLDFLLAEMENNVGKIVFILAGYNKEMEKFFEHNPGLRSRVPYQLQFEDYNDSELLLMFTSLVNTRYEGKMKVEGGVAGLFSRIVIARLGRQRGCPGFGNMRALQNVFDRITGQQAKRLAKDRRARKSPDDYLLTKEDLIGPEPSEALRNNFAWKKLQKLTGLTTVKQSVKDMMGMIEANYWREMKEDPPLDVSLNRVFLGSPGTGKTSVAKLYGRILADLRLLSNGEVVIKNPADFVGSALGQSEANTKAILAATVGKVLIIDEAYMLHGGTSGDDKNSTDIYKTAVIDTIVAEVQSVPGEDRCVLLLGYKEEMEKMFQHVNPGLARRFSVENAFHFKDFTDLELREILDFKLKSQRLVAIDEAKDVAIGVLSRMRARPNFGNAGEVENLISSAKTHNQARMSSLSAKERANVVFLPQDFDPNFNRGKDASTNLVKLFEDIVGCDDIVRRLDGYQKTALKAKERGLEMRELIPTNFVFKGPPGTGKTTVARKIGQVYYDMGFLSSPEVVECSASELVGQYVGQTGPKTKNQLKKALGRVLFIDEAYRLCDGPFAKEAIDELVASLTLAEFLNKIIVIFAGYDHDIDRLLMANAGLSSRFSEQIIFSNMSPEHCLEVLHSRLHKKGITFPAVQERDSETYQSMKRLIGELSVIPSWGNARDIETLSKKMTNAALIDDTQPNFSGVILLRDKLALIIMTQLLDERRSRSYTPPPSTFPYPQGQAQTRSPTIRSQPQTTASSTTAQETSPQKSAPQKSPEQPLGENNSSSVAVERDSSVSDDVWQQLQRDRGEAEAVERKARLNDLEAGRAIQDILLRERKAKSLKLTMEMQAKYTADIEKKKRLEQARLEELRIRAEKEMILFEIERRKKAEEQRRRLEVKAQAKLRQMGVCCMGYQWIKQTSGYRCVGGSHFVSNEQLNL